jgi:hypothetical protein
MCNERKGFSMYIDRTEINWNDTDYIQRYKTSGTHRSKCGQPRLMDPGESE